MSMPTGASRPSVAGALVMCAVGIAFVLTYCFIELVKARVFGSVFSIHFATRASGTGGPVVGMVRKSVFSSRRSAFVALYSGIGLGLLAGIVFVATNPPRSRTDPNSPTQYSNTQGKQLLKVMASSMAVGLIGGFLVLYRARKSPTGDARGSLIRQAGQDPTTSLFGDDDDDDEPSADRRTGLY